MGKGFKMGGGGASQLNFKVVGGAAAPESPKENTIWVHTDSEITGWEFSAEEPQSAEGMVWFQTGADSSIQFNALKKNALRVYTIAVKQWDGSAWSNLNASLYSGGQWTPLWDGSLYTDGSYVKITGFNIKYTTSSGPTMTVSNSGTTLSFNMGTSSSTSRVGTAYTKEKIDLTAFNTLKINILSGSAVYWGANTGIGISKDVPTYSGDKPGNAAVFSTFSGYNPSGIMSLDISSLSGEYYFFVSLSKQSSTYSSLKTDKIWLE